MVSPMKKLGFLLLIPVLAAALLLPGIRRDIRQQSRAEIRDAVLRAAVECYAVEGVYPSSLSYLETHYGLQINHRDYLVIYDAFAGNLMPQVQVLVLGEG